MLPRTKVNPLYAAAIWLAAADC
ncbi:protein of unknown function [Cupriavidus taiwanensis]|nr:hypothetical protein CBM2606_A90271 [Cupriavidus taiwanensis]SPA41738.1 protein of unknown function [Cupriavidus taiwanensis]